MTVETQYTGEPNTVIARLDRGEQFDVIEAMWQTHPASKMPMDENLRMHLKDMFFGGFGACTACVPHFNGHQFLEAQVEVINASNHLGYIEDREPKPSQFRLVS